MTASRERYRSDGSRRQGQQVSTVGAYGKRNNLFSLLVLEIPTKATEAIGSNPRDTQGSCTDLSLTMEKM